MYVLKGNSMIYSECLKSEFLAIPPVSIWYKLHNLSHWKMV